MSALELSFYSGRDNVEDILLLSNGTPVDTQHITAFKLEFLYPQGPTLDSSHNAECFEWPVTLPASPYAKTKANGLRLKLGQAGLAEGRHAARLIVLDIDHPHGLVWDGTLTVFVYA